MGHIVRIRWIELINIPSVDQAKGLQAPWPAEHASPRVIRVALVTLKVVPAVQQAPHDLPKSRLYPKIQGTPSFPRLTRISCKETPLILNYLHGRSKFERSCRGGAGHANLEYCRVLLNVHTHDVTGEKSSAY